MGLCPVAERCGSYPFMNIAEDYAVDYWAVLCYADALRDSNLENEISVWGVKAGIHLAEQNPSALDAIFRKVFPDAPWFGKVG